MTDKNNIPHVIWTELRRKQNRSRPLFNKNITTASQKQELIIQIVTKQENKKQNKI